jgi:hypothetical protein
MKVLVGVKRVIDYAAKVSRRSRNSSLQEFALLRCAEIKKRTCQRESFLIDVIAQMIGAVRIVRLLIDFAHVRVAVSTHFQKNASLVDTRSEHALLAVRGDGGVVGVAVLPGAGGGEQEWGRSEQRQDVDEPLLRDRRRGGGARARTSADARLVWPSNAGHLGTSG